MIVENIYGMYHNRRAISCLNLPVLMFKEAT